MFNAAAVVVRLYVPTPCAHAGLPLSFIHTHAHSPNLWSLHLLLCGVLRHSCSSTGEGGEVTAAVVHLARTRVHTQRMERPVSGCHVYMQHVPIDRHKIDDNESCFVLGFSGQTFLSVERAKTTVQCILSTSCGRTKRGAATARRDRPIKAEWGIRPIAVHQRAFGAPIWLEGSTDIVHND